MFEVLKKPRWIVLTVLVIAVIATFIRLGFWQLGRLEERRAYNQRFTQRYEQPELSINEAWNPISAPSFAENTSYMRARVTGHYDTSNEIVLLSRSLRGISGHHVLTPLLFSDDLAVLVDRGWVSEVMRTPPVAGAEPPPGEVTVHGILLPSQTRGLLGPKQLDASSRQLFRVEIPLIEQRLPYEVLGVYLQLTDQEPAQRGEFPKMITEPPRLDEGPHRSYAIQWFAFALTAAVTYAVLLRRATRKPDERISPENGTIL